MHSRAKICGVPFGDASAGEFKQHWSHGESLKQLITDLLGRYKKQPGLRLKHAILREVVQTVDVALDELKNTRKRIANKRPNPLYKQRQREIKNMRESGVPLLEAIFLQDAFSNNRQRCKKFLSSYNKFNKSFIHISHAPINDSIGMDAQVTSSVVNTKVWKALEGTAYTSLIKRTVKRDIFYNS